MTKSLQYGIFSLLVLVSPLRADSYEPIGQAATQSADTAKSKLSWQKVALITGVFAVAVVTVVFAVHYSGHKK